MRLWIFVCAFVGGWIFWSPSQAAAQVCQHPKIIQCGETLSGDTTSGTDTQNLYCGYFNRGLEHTYLLAVPQDQQVDIYLRPNGYDATLTLMKSKGQDCDPSQCIRRDDNGIGYQEHLVSNVYRDLYYIVVDGFYNTSFGKYELQVVCTPIAACVDADLDGHLVENADCPFDEVEDDCDDSQPAIHTGAAEICGDGIDQNCDAVDLACPGCVADQQIESGQSGQAVLSQYSDDFQAYCGEPADWTGPEIIYEFVSTLDGMCTFAAEAPTDIDVFVLSGIEPDQCDRSDCLVTSRSETGSEQVSFYAHHNQPYYFVVDGYDAASPAFDWSLMCQEQHCQYQQSLTCGQTISNTTSNHSDQMSFYPDLNTNFFGPDSAFAFESDRDQLVTLELSIPQGERLSLLVLEESSVGCSSAYLLAVDDDVGVTSVTSKRVFFWARAQTTYTLVVDGVTVEDYGDFVLKLDCNEVCQGPNSKCLGRCVDLQHDPQHCGVCENACGFANAQPLCQAGQCVLASCLDGFADCNNQIQDGCESSLDQAAHCGSCDQVCQQPDECLDRTCVSSCNEGETACDAACVDLSHDPDHCGACNHFCDLDHARAVCIEAQCQIMACESGYADCNQDPDDGCEVDLASDLVHCGACQAPCVADHAQTSCIQGECVLTVCEEGYANCNDNELDGCEVQLQTPQHCAGCGDACAADNAVADCEINECQLVQCVNGFADCNDSLDDGCESDLTSPTSCGGCGQVCQFEHAVGRCEEQGCVIESCASGYADCNQNVIDGCEADLSASATCGSCSNECQEQQACQAGVCVTPCIDSDQDGFLDQACGGQDCDDSQASINPQAEEICGDGIDQDCSGEDLACGCEDADQDGFSDKTCGGQDCDDKNADIHPGAQEVCGDQIDQDCSGEDLPCDCPDSDQDGFEDQDCGGPDCDDQDASRNPHATEICGDGIDQDCDGKDLPCAHCPDDDGDGYASSSCGGDDCNDRNASIHPRAVDICGDGLDQNCDGKDNRCSPTSGCAVGAGSPSSSFSFLIFCLILLECIRWSYGKCDKE